MTARRGHDPVEGRVIRDHIAPKTAAVNRQYVRGVPDLMGEQGPSMPLINSSAEELRNFSTSILSLRCNASSKSRPGPQRPTDAPRPFSSEEAACKTS